METAGNNFHRPSTGQAVFDRDVGLYGRRGNSEEEREERGMLSWELECRGVHKGSKWGWRLRTGSLSGCRTPNSRTCPWFSPRLVEAFERLVASLFPPSTSLLSTTAQRLNAVCTKHPQQRWVFSSIPSRLQVYSKHCLFVSTLHSTLTAFIQTLHVPRAQCCQTFSGKRS